MTTIKHFKVDTNRDKLYPSIECYQMPLIGVVNEAMQDGKLEEHLPSWTKFSKDPIKSEGFFRYMLKAIFAGETDCDDLKVNYILDQRGEAVSSRRVAMMFLPGNTRRDNMEKIKNIATETLPNFEVVLLTGLTTTNRNAEAKVKEVLELNPNKSVLILSAQMAQRSFSIPEIQELYLAYDNGESGSTVQKISRTLTPSDEGKTGRIFSLSFDPNRDDKFDSLILTPALNVQKKTGADINTILSKIVNRSLDIFKMVDGRPVKFDKAEFIKEALERNSVSRVIGKVADISSIPDELCISLSNGIANVSMLDKVDSATKGKTYESTPPKKNANKKPTKNQEAKVREMITTVVENIDIVVHGTQTANVCEALKIVREQNCEYVVENEFGVPFETVEFLFDQDIINQNMVDVRLDLSQKSA